MQYNKSLIEAARKILCKEDETILYESILLLEDRIDFLKEKNPEIDISHDTLAQHKNSNDIIDHFAQHADPSSNKMYTQWILNQYKKKNVRQEDAPRIKTSLDNFNRYKGKLDKKDINQYDHIVDVENAVEPHLGSASSKNEEIRQIKDDGADLIHSENGLTVHKLKTKEAACQYGAGTKWCTAAKQNNMFDHYNNMGPLYVIQKNGKKHQFHIQSNQFMDEQDKNINLHKFIKENPELKNVKEFKNSHPAFDSEEEQINQVLKGENHNYINKVFSSNIKLPDDVVHHYIDKISSMAEEKPNTVNVANIGSIIENEHLNSDHLDKLYNYSKNNNVKYHIANIAKHLNIGEKTSHKILDDSTKDLNYSANILLQNPNVSPSVLEKATEIKQPIAHELVAKHPSTPMHVLSNMANSKNHIARSNALMNPSTDESIIAKHHDDPRVHFAISVNPHASSETLRKIFNENKDNEYLHQNLAGNKSTPPDILKLFAESHPNEKIAKKAEKTLKSIKVK